MILVPNKGWLDIRDIINKYAPREKIMYFSPPVGSLVKYEDRSHHDDIPQTVEKIKLIGELEFYQGFDENYDCIIAWHSFVSGREMPYMTFTNGEKIGREDSFDEPFYEIVEGKMKIEFSDL